ncbi:MAG TPA: hypothetical protein VK846_02090 [Candidatus Limnocylindria bacterium]|nr:hypothetical protein [Candidatus Limnocylindria bacterium]
MPESVVRFIASHIRSLEQLEVLLLLSAQPHRDWTAADVYNVVRSSEASIFERLDELRMSGLLSSVESGGSVAKTYRFAPSSPELAAVTDLLAHEHKERRVKIVELIYSPQAEPLKGFADAFKFKKDK